MEKSKKQQAITICREAYATLEDAKSDCKDVVDSAIDALCEIDENYDNKTRKDILEGNNNDIKAIKKTAKALATGKLDQVKNESSAISDLVDELNIEQ